MDRVVSLLIVVAVLVAWLWLVPAGARSRRQSPLWGAFTATAAAILFVTAGAVGYKLNHGLPFTVTSAWTRSVIWSQVWVSLAAALAAAPLWRVGLQSIRRSLQESADGSRSRTPNESPRSRLTSA
jgi:hypothetical protein